MTMKNIVYVLAVLFIVSGCSSKRGMQPMDMSINAAPTENIETAADAESAALAYYRKGVFERSAEFFLEAANIYRDHGHRGLEIRALEASAKSRLWAGDRDGFIQAMNRVRGLQHKYEIPGDDLATLLNIADRMEGKDELSYPILRGQHELFSN